MCTELLTSKACLKTLLKLILLSEHTVREVAKQANMNEKSLVRKINGDTLLSFKEMCKLRDAVAPKMSLDDLFIEVLWPLSKTEPPQG